MRQLRVQFCSRIAAAECNLWNRGNEPVLATAHEVQQVNGRIQMLTNQVTSLVN
jgi:hypothetical protein